MTATDIRNANFEQLRDSLEERRREVYEAFVCHGPCTTRQLADAARMDILSVRPRASELVDIGLLVITGFDTSRGKREGIYRATDLNEWRAWHAQQFPVGEQIQMGLNQGALTA